MIKHHDIIGTEIKVGDLLLRSGEGRFSNGNICICRSLTEKKVGITNGYLWKSNVNPQSLVVITQQARAEGSYNALMAPFSEVVLDNRPVEVKPKRIVYFLTLMGRSAYIDNIAAADYFTWLPVVNGTKANLRQALDDLGYTSSVIVERTKTGYHPNRFFIRPMGNAVKLAQNKVDPDFIGGVTIKPISKLPYEIRSKFTDEW